jgi:beta-glucosidase
MILPYRQDDLIEKLLAVNPDMIVIMHAGSPVDMSRWAAKAKTIVWSYYSGCEGGHALADVLLGDVNPSGHLPETFAWKLEDYSSHSIGEFPGTGEKVRYLEGSSVGYRHFDSTDTEPLFAFGHGLSYTEFALSDLKINGTEISLTAENTGGRKGKAVVQLYAGNKLSSFKKIPLEAGEKQQLQFTAPAGNYEVKIGFSSRDIRLKGKINNE